MNSTLNFKRETDIGFSREIESGIHSSGSEFFCGIEINGISFELPKLCNVSKNKDEANIGPLLKNSLFTKRREKND